MDFWHLVLIGGLITWTACVFLRAVAARTHLLRMEMLPAPAVPDVEVVEVEDSAGQAASQPQLLPDVLPNRQSDKDGNAKPPGSPWVKPAGHGKASGNGSSNGNGHAKVPLKRPSR